MSKAEIYLEAYNWITNKFNGGSPDIQLADKDLSSIIARTVIKGAAVSNTVWLKFSADLRCLLRVDAKEGRCRLSITVQGMCSVALICLSLCRWRRSARFVFPFY